MILNFKIVFIKISYPGIDIIFYCTENGRIVREIEFYFIEISNKVIFKPKLNMFYDCFTFSNKTLIRTACNLNSIIRQMISSDFRFSFDISITPTAVVLYFITLVYMGPIV